MELFEILVKLASSFWLWKRFNPGLVLYIWNPNLVITVPSDELEHHCAGPSSSTVSTIDIFFTKCLSQSMISYHLLLTRWCLLKWLDRAKSWHTSSVNKQGTCCNHHARKLLSHPKWSSSHLVEYWGSWWTQTRSPSTLGQFRVLVVPRSEASLSCHLHSYEQNGSDTHTPARQKELTHWSLGDVVDILKVWSTSCEIAHRWMPQNTLMISQHWLTCNGLVPSGNKPLPEPMMIQIYVAIWCH